MTKKQTELLAIEEAAVEGKDYEEVVCVGMDEYSFDRIDSIIMVVHCLLLVYGFRLCLEFIEYYQYLAVYVTILAFFGPLYYLMHYLINLVVSCIISKIIDIISFLSRIFPNLPIPINFRMIEGKN